MLAVIGRSVVIFILLVLGIRLMGKRTIGELQPYEFVITLAVADLACSPMQDISVPLLYGLVPLFTVFVAHYFLTMLTAASVKFRRALNGKPFIVIDNDGINSECLKKLNMNVNDLLALIRQQGYFSIPEISYGIIETNGKLSIMGNSSGGAPETLPTTLIVEGKFLDANLETVKITRGRLEGILDGKGLRAKNVVLMTTDETNFFIQPKKSKYIVFGAAL